MLLDRWRRIAGWCAGVRPIRGAKFALLVELRRRIVHVEFDGDLARDADGARKGCGAKGLLTVGDVRALTIESVLEGVVGRPAVGRAALGGSAMTTGAENDTRAHDAGDHLSKGGVEGRVALRSLRDEGNEVE
eukprot:GHVL01037909.1.p2 GENE.GHVL01037909.1~~GHVL01037909.1.p2  ORF type:complete len:133 (-),score=13.29 GHVL01037909.1:533-931(-)